jgi:hypothetical protein
MIAGSAIQDHVKNKHVNYKVFLKLSFPGLPVGLEAFLSP